MLCLAPASSFAKGKGGVGFVLLTSILRSKMEVQPLTYVCSDTFKTTKKNSTDPWSADLYSIELFEEKLNIFTKTSPSNVCANETLQDLEERHPCLATRLEQAVQRGIDLAEDLQRSYDTLIREGIYLGNVNPEYFRYRIMVSSTDKNLSFIDVEAWDFSWLTDWVPFISEDSCPFKIEFRHELKEPNKPPQLIQSYPL